MNFPLYTADFIEFFPDRSTPKSRIFAAQVLGKKLLFMGVGTLAIGVRSEQPMLPPWKHFA
jgi:hypothetical protein